MYIPKHFEIQELVPPALFRKIEKKPVGWGWQVLFDDRLLITIDRLREKFGPMQVNTWYNGGKFMYRGFRPPQSNVGAALSQHRFGRAVDMVPIDNTVEIVREAILDCQSSIRYKYIGAIELEVPWLHIDVRAKNFSNNIMTFSGWTACKP